MEEGRRRRQLRELSRTELMERVLKLEDMFSNIHWMARRYADKRSSAAVSTYNDAVSEAKRMGVSLFTGDGSVYARDGMGRNYDHLPAEEAAKLETNGADVFCDGCRIREALAALSEKADLKEIPEKHRETICNIIAYKFNN